jgi:hypothetical protein
VRPKYRVRLSVVCDIEVCATSASGAIETAKAIAGEMVKGKKFPAVFISASEEDVRRIFPSPLEGSQGFRDCLLGRTTEGEKP